ncbi:hypothetical protein COI_2424 [Mannheimia haemolytica serotype A2 str. OVINE]|nr:hypothetical protein COI_2424 [Mannheimia haemolytica serotype A2 str. OVINE]
MGFLTIFCLNILVIQHIINLFSVIVLETSRWRPLIPPTFGGITNALPHYPSYHSLSD